MDKLFTYGILQDPPVIRSIIGRLPPSVPALLKDHVSLQVRGAHYPGLRPSAGSVVKGVLYLGLTADEFKALDQFEGDAYQRLSVVVATDVEPAPVSSWVYMFRHTHVHLLTDEVWTLEGQKAKDPALRGPSV